MSEDFGSDFVTIIDDEGNEFELEVIESMDYNGHTYRAFLPADMSEDDPDYGFVLLRVVEDENGDEYFEDIPDDDEYDTVADLFINRLQDAFEIDEE